MTGICRYNGVQVNWVKRAKQSLEAIGSKDNNSIVINFKKAFPRSPVARRFTVSSVKYIWSTYKNKDIPETLEPVKDPAAKPRPSRKSQSRKQSASQAEQTQSIVSPSLFRQGPQTTSNPPSVNQQQENGDSGRTKGEQSQAPARVYPSNAHDVEWEIFKAEVTNFLQTIQTSTPGIYNSNEMSVNDDA